MVCCLPWLVHPWAERRRCDLGFRAYVLRLARSLCRSTNGCACNRLVVQGATGYQKQPPCNSSKAAAPWTRSQFTARHVHMFQAPCLRQTRACQPRAAASPPPGRRGVAAAGGAAGDRGCRPRPLRPPPGALTAASSALPHKPARTTLPARRTHARAHAPAPRRPHRSIVPFQALERLLAPCVPADAGHALDSAVAAQQQADDGNRDGHVAPVRGGAGHAQGGVPALRGGGGHQPGSAGDGTCQTPVCSQREGSTIHHAAACATLTAFSKCLWICSPAVMT